MCQVVLFFKTKTVIRKQIPAKWLMDSKFGVFFFFPYFCFFFKSWISLFVIAFSFVHYFQLSPIQWDGFVPTHFGLAFNISPPQICKAATVSLIIQNGVFKTCNGRRVSFMRSDPNPPPPLPPSPSPASLPIHYSLIPLLSLIMSFFIFILRFWNQILTCLSVRFNSPATSRRRSLVRYIL